MNSRQGILFLIAGVVAICIALLVRGLIGHSAPDVHLPSSQPPPTVYVVVAARDIAPGEVLRGDMVAWQAWPKGSPSASFLNGNGATPPGSMVNGMVARAAFLKGQPLSPSAMIHGDTPGVMAAALAPGMRAVTIPVSMTMAVAGFLQPNDHMDILLTQNQGGKPAAVVALADVRVLAVDQVTEAHPPAPDAKSLPDVHMVTFELTPEQTKTLVQAQAAGTLSLSLRPLADGGEGAIKIIRGRLGPDQVGGGQK